MTYEAAYDLASQRLTAKASALGIVIPPELIELLMALLMSVLEECMNPDPEPTPEKAIARAKNAGPALRSLLTMRIYQTRRLGLVPARRLAVGFLDVVGEATPEEVGAFMGRAS